MSLFDIAELEKENKVDSTPGFETDSVLINGASIKFFKQFLGKLEQNKHYHFWSGGQWNMQDLLNYILFVTGPANVFITTYAISEAAVISLMNLRDRKAINELQCVFDFKCKEQKGKSYLLAKNNFPVTLSAIHAKVAVIANAEWKITITGSANWTRNPRAERQVMCTVPEIVEGDIKIIKQLIAGDKPFKVR